MANMEFKYDDGSNIEITKDVFVKLMQEVSGLMVAYTVEKYGWSRKDVQTLGLTNRVMRETWDNHEWLEKMIGYMYKRAKEINDGRNIDETR